MFFKRSKGDFRETERITRYKLIKSGKNWVRASVSRLGLFRVLRGGVDENIVVQYEASSHSMPADLVQRDGCARGAGWSDNGCQSSIC